MVRTEAELWIEVEGRRVVTDEVAAVLDGIRSTGSLSAAAERLGVAYSHAWGLVNRLEDAAGEEIVEGRTGGPEGGGSELTARGRELLAAYRDRARALEAATDERFWDALGYQLSARNRLAAEVTSVDRDDVAAHVTLRIDGPVEIQSLISRRAADELDLDEGETVEAVVKATEVMVGRPGAVTRTP